MIRVALGSVYPHDESRVHGGVEAVALYLTRALAKRDDVELHVVSCNRTIKQSCTEHRGSVTFHWLAAGQRLYGLRAATIDAWRVKQIYVQIHPDIIHAQHFGTYAVAAHFKVPVVLTFHGVESLVPHMQKTEHFRGAVGHYRKCIAGHLLQESISKCTAIVDNSGGYVSRLLGAKLNGKPNYRIANPIADDFFSIEHPENTVNRHPLILWAGQISERKNVIDLLHAFAVVTSCFPNARLSLVGNISDPKYFRRMRDTIIAQELTDKVTVIGHVKQHELLQLYSNATILAMSSIEETAPMFLAQAMAAGKPVVATRVGGIPWMVENGVTGYLVDVGDTQGMADRLVELLQNGSKRYEMGQAARQVARERFAADRVAEKTVQAYRELLGGKREDD